MGLLYIRTNPRTVRSILDSDAHPAKRVRDENMGRWGPSTSPSPKTGRNMLVCAGGDDQLPFSVPVAHGSVNDQPGGRGKGGARQARKRSIHPKTRLLSQAHQLRTDLGEIARNRIFSNRTPSCAQPWSRRGRSSSKRHQIICRCSRSPSPPGMWYQRSSGDDGAPQNATQLRRCAAVAYLTPEIRHMYGLSEIHEHRGDERHAGRRFMRSEMDGAQFGRVRKL
jgi:hypothetical protein